MNRRKKIDRRLAARQAGYSGESPGDKTNQTATVKPGSRNARKAH